jgi:colanic acid/amylovoran/stewartan biosynthesis glycosyltransferase WcaL/AmsK/CpsK
MRIAFFADAFPDLAVTFIINQVVGMLERGHEVVVFAQRPGQSREEHPQAREWNLRSRTRYIGPSARGSATAPGVLSAFFRHPLRSGVLLRSLPPWTTGVESRTLRYFAATEAFLEGEEFDVVHCHFGPNGNIAVRLRDHGLLSAPIVTTFHGYDMRRGVMTLGNCFARLREAGDAFLSISGYNRALLEEWGFPAERIHDHPVGVDPDRFVYRGPRSSANGAVRILSVANLVPVKGHEHLLDALAMLRETDPSFDFALRVVGDGPTRPNLEAQIERLGLGAVVQLLGARDQAGVLAELQAADVFVLSSLAEATPVALMEAQCVGLPVVATRVGAVHEVVVDGSSGLLVPPGDAEQMALALREVCGNRSRWQPMGRAGRDHVVSHYDIHRLLDELEHLYAAVQTGVKRLS